MCMWSKLMPTMRNFAMSFLPQPKNQRCSVNLT
jgi:hypothetical protein